MEENEFMRFATDHAHELILFFDETGRVFYANLAANRWLEYGDQMNITSIVDIFPSLFTVGVGKLTCSEEMDGHDIETEAYRRNRTCFNICVKFEKIGDGIYSAIGYETTEIVQMRKKVQEVDLQIAEALKVKSEFTANVTHELRTPVNGISGNTRELLEKETEPGKVRLLQLIERGCQDMHAIINNVLDFSKLEAGKFTLETREFVFRDMIDYAVSNHKSKINDKGLDFFITVASEIPERVIGDELRIVQILNNLLSNAVKFTSAGKIILEVVMTAQVDNRIELFFLVIDSGIGIAKENQDKLFQSFSQVDASITRKYGGTGLGLNITKQLVEMMGGSIHLESEYGKGSMFSFHIWLDLPKDEVSEAKGVDLTSNEQVASYSLDDFDIANEMWNYGSEDNRAEIDKKMQKIILCIDMENWEKAEGFADAVKKMTAQAPKDVKTAALRLKMAVQKEDQEKAREYHKTLKGLLDEEKVGNGV